jgi:hypothetical protein
MSTTGFPSFEITLIDQSLHQGGGQAQNARSFGRA